MWILGLTFFFGRLKVSEKFLTEIDFYEPAYSQEAKFLFLSGRRLHLRGGGGGVANAQLFVHVYPSQDNPTNQTLWIFSGSSQTAASGNIRSSGNDFLAQDSWEVSDKLFNANKPDNQVITLSPLFSSSNTNDIESVRTRTAGVWGAGSPFANNATNTPTITISSGSRTIASFYLDEDPPAGDEDDMGIRVSGSTLSYSAGQSSAWVGSGIINKPIGDFFAGTFNNAVVRDLGTPSFAAQSNGSVRVIVNSQIIPEPEEYALVFGLFALGFVIVRRHFQKKRQQSAAS